MKLRRNVKFLSIEKFIEKDNVETEVKGNLGRSSNLKFKMLKTPTRYNGPTSRHRTQRGNHARHAQT
jgi:hypothetical protein